MQSCLDGPVTESCNQGIRRLDVSLRAEGGCEPMNEWRWRCPAGWPVHLQAEVWLRSPPGLPGDRKL